MTASLTALTSADFIVFFREIYGYEPFPWQVELTRLACAGSWPEYLSVPTGSGKTAALDAAVFALAVQASRPPAERTVGRRIFYVVNRRVIVDEAYDRARKITAALRSPRDNQPTVTRVAAALRSLNPGSASPLDCVQLRGGIYRDQRWARSLTQPLIVASTVDQVGSRLLFRGYGVSPSMRPIHAALVAHDSLLLLDEAHISRPFAQTLASIAAYRAHGSGRSHKPDAAPPVTVRTPFAFLQMTATPPAKTPETAILRLTKADRDKPTLGVRLEATKSATLAVAEKASGAKALAALATRLYEEAVQLIKAHQPRSIAILVNRVATAREVEKILVRQFSPNQVTLLIGRMRPLDRDEITQALRTELKTRQPGELAPALACPSPRIVVATQCLEVGADFDFDALVTECASLDALRQRFGRLNRGGRAIEAYARIVIRADQIFDDTELETNPKAADPIYNTALARTWNWLSSIAAANVVDFGLNAMDAHVATLRKSEAGDAKFSGLLSPSTDAPVLLPAYLDAWCQTNPEPAPLPEPALFLHGPSRNNSDVQVCWRADLPEGLSVDDWIATVSLCPPTSVECLTVPLCEFRLWFLGGVGPDNGDVLDAAPTEDPEIITPVERHALVWRGLHDSQFLESTSGPRPGDTIVLRAQDGGWESLGHLPGATTATVDHAERAFRQTKQLEILRLRPAFFPAPAKDSALAELLAWATDENRDLPKAALREILKRVHGEFFGDKSISDALAALSDEKLGLKWEPYPDEQGVVFKTRHRKQSPNDAAESDDDGEDSLSVSELPAPLSLEAHVADVVAATQHTLGQVPLAAWQSAFESAAALHDWGKADERFQALLLNIDPTLVWAGTTLFAKSAKMPETAAAYEAARHRARLPKGFRHEMLSVQLAEAHAGAFGVPNDELLRTLALHLIASHHGYARPFAPVITDDAPPDVEFEHDNTCLNFSAVARIARPAHRIDSGIAERFWQLNRHFGWWGLAYLEAVLRLADQQASANPQPAAATS